MSEKIITPKNLNTKKIQDANKLRKTLGLMVSAMAFIIYLNTINHAYVLDDFSIISENSVTTKGIKAIPDIFSHFYRYGFYAKDDGIYRPLSVAMFALEWSISPNNPSLGHLINILFYTLTGWVVFITLARLLKNYSLVFPFIVSLLFITHPIHTEVVANIKSRDELMCFLLSFSTLYYLLDYVESLSKQKLFGSSVLFLAAFLFKETAITMLVILPLALYFFTNVKRKTLVISIVSLSTVAVIFLIIRYFVLSGGESLELTRIENSLLISSNGLDRTATAIKILGNYLALLFYPNILLCDYSFNHIPIVNFSNPKVWVTVLIYLGIAIYALFGFFKKDLLAFGILFYFITIALFSNIIFIIGGAMAERFVYFASFGFCFALAVILMKLTKVAFNRTNFTGLPDFFNKNRTVLLITISLGFLYSVKTISRNANWKDNYTLYNQDLKNAPGNARVHFFLGNEIIKNIAPFETNALKRVALYQAGIAELKNSLNIYPEYPEPLNDLGAAYFKIDSLDQAEYYFKKALIYYPRDLNNLGYFYFAKKDYTRAIEIYRESIVLNPKYIDGYVNLGVCYGTLKNYENAIACFTKAQTLEPTNPQVYYMLSTAYKFNGDSLNYEKAYQKALEFDPTLPKP